MRAEWGDPSARIRLWETAPDGVGLRFVSHLNAGDFVYSKPGSFTLPVDHHCAKWFVALPVWKPGEPPHDVVVTVDDLNGERWLGRLGDWTATKEDGLYLLTARWI